MSTLINKNIMVAGHRTSMRLEPEMWDALAEICEREKCSIKEICTLIDASRGSTSLTSAVRVFILAYFRFAVANNNTERRESFALAATNKTNAVLESPPSSAGSMINTIVTKIFS